MAHNYLARYQIIYPDYPDSVTGSMYLSNGNGNGDGDKNGNGDNVGKQSEYENKTAEEPEKKRWTGIPDPPETTSRIPTYDEFARQRDSSRPPDSHYYTPGPYKRSTGKRNTCDTILIYIGLCILSACFNIM
ncbi:unnamed protein product [Diatraea saccharalis]|uniref:Uncharacterized protein n=1 Tax=Diatraea saccharalis TaxID=40085 RepID=A0A9N9W8A4_9NEOP|nr:unnamed protein product [Diatraea saccharalis]